MKDWERGYWAGSLIGIIGLVVGVVIVASTSTSACAQTSWENNPLNYKNSSYNYENSQYNYKNSQYNWENSSYNMDSKTGVYNDQGNRIGYQVQNNQGTRNIYDNNGNRIGYAK
jgi:hypothetical protein